MRRGFTLLELSAAMAIAGFIAAAALSATVSIQRSFVATRKVVALGDDARMTLEHILDKARLAGGGLVRPWQAVSVSCANTAGLPVCAPTDPFPSRRLSLLELEPLGQGRIESATGTTLQVRVPAGGTCALSSANGYRAVTPVVVVAPEARLPSYGGAVWLTATCAAVANGSACTCELRNVGAPGFSSPRANGTPPPLSEFVGGVISRGRVLSYGMDRDGQLIMLRSDFQDTGVAATTALAPNALAFDVRLAYDYDSDGDIDALQGIADVGAIGALRAVRVGIALSAPMADGIASTATFFGTPLTAAGRRTVALEGSALLRSTGVFQ